MWLSFPKPLSDNSLCATYILSRLVTLLSKITEFNRKKKKKKIAPHARSRTARGSSALYFVGCFF